VPDNLQSSVVAICDSCRHYSPTFASMAAFRLLEAPSRVLFWVLLPAALGWPTLLAFLLFSFGCMVRVLCCVSV